MRWAVPVLVGALLVLSLAATPAAATPTHDETTFVVEIQENGDAVWTVSTTYVLENQSDEQAFETVRSDHESGADPSPDPALFEAAIDAVAAETNRDMELTGINRSSTVRDGENVSYGVLRLSFTWTNFAVVTEDKVSVDAAFAGGWFGDLAANQTLLLEPPAEYRHLRANPSTDIVNGGLQWEGPQTFEANEPTVVFEAFEPPPPGLEALLSPMAAGIGGAILGAALLFAWRRDLFGRSGDEASAQAAEPGDDTTEMGAAEPEPATPESGAEEPPAEPTPAVDTELLSDEERVEDLLQQIS
ncbi:MAG: hypothetical protein KGY43_04445, partial [Halodesulfurarchaeum sp.]|nr:hypothetical protein [Halodesulfurarchaeum sp.]